MEALLLIDIQNDYFPGGKMSLHEPDAASKNAAAILSEFRRHGKKVIHVQHIATRADATFFLPNTVGADIHPSVAPQPQETVVIKHFPNSFRDTTLLDALQRSDVDSLVVVGMMTHMCVDTTVRAAADLGFRCTLVEDACATKALEFAGRRVSAEQVQLAYLAALDGSFANVVSSQSVLTSSQH
jgi:nicotinamidase-related amidase